jgi:uncharacterized protein YgiM (DUF1202 family)
MTAWILIVAFGLTGCATIPGSGGKTQWDSPGQCIAANTIGGAAIGALTGALLGAISGEKNGAGKGAIIGGVGGGVIAFAIAWGKCFAAFSTVKSQEVKNYIETQKEINYKKGQGDITEIKSFDLQPYVAPGKKLKFKADYVVMTDTDKKDIPVTETRILKVFDPEKKQFDEVGAVPETVIVAPRIRHADGEVLIPEDTPEGKYMIAFKIESLNKTDIKELPFTVTKDNKLLAMNKIKFTDENIYASSGTKDVQPNEKKFLIVTAAKLNIRELPDKSSKIIGKLSKGDKPLLIDNKTIEGEKWFQIKIDDEKNGWISSSGSQILEE